MKATFSLIILFCLIKNGSQQNVTSPAELKEVEASKCPVTSMGMKPSINEIKAGDLNGSKNPEFNSNSLAESPGFKLDSKEAERVRNALSPTLMRSYLHYLKWEDQWISNVTERLRHIWGSPKSHEDASPNDFKMVESKKIDIEKKDLETKLAQLAQNQSDMQAKNSSCDHSLKKEESNEKKASEPDQFNRIRTIIVTPNGAMLPKTSRQNVLKREPENIKQLNQSKEEFHEHKEKSSKKLEPENVVEKTELKKKLSECIRNMDELNSQKMKNEKEMAEMNQRRRLEKDLHSKVQGLDPKNHRVVKLDIHINRNINIINNSLKRKSRQKMISRRNEDLGLASTEILPTKNLKESRAKNSVFDVRECNRLVTPQLIDKKKTETEKLFPVCEQNKDFKLVEFEDKQKNQPRLEKCERKKKDSTIPMMRRENKIINGDTLRKKEITIEENALRIKTGFAPDNRDCKIVAGVMIDNKYSSPVIKGEKLTSKCDNKSIENRILKPKNDEKIYADCKLETKNDDKLSEDGPLKPRISKTTSQCAEKASLMACDASDSQGMAGFEEKENPFGFEDGFGPVSKCSDK